jgi:hypothetical protein
VKAWFRSLSEAYGWTPRQIGRLTLPQARIYLSDGRGKRRLSLAEYRALTGRGGG